MSALRKMRHAVLARSPLLMSAANAVKSSLHKSAPVTQLGLAEAASPATAASSAQKIYPSARAQRPIGIFYDELSRGINPFSLIETCGVADVTDPVEKIVELFDRFNLVKVRRVYSPERSRELNQHCINFSGLSPLDFRDVFAGKKKWATGGSPVLNDQNFWSYAADAKVKEIINALLGKNAFEFGTAVAAHYSARGLHRDYRMLVEKDDSAYSVHNPQKRIIRVLHYCSTAGGALGYIPFSNNEPMFAQQSKRCGQKHPTAWFDRHREALTKARREKSFTDADEIERHICWAYADPGDIIVSNSAMLHCGEYLTGPRYFFVSTYAESNAETLKLATGGARNNPTAQAYYRFMAEQGFKGSNDILKAVGV